MNIVNFLHGFKIKFVQILERNFQNKTRIFTTNGALIIILYLILNIS